MSHYLVPEVSMRDYLIQEYYKKEEEADCLTRIILRFQPLNMHLICLQTGDVVYIHGACFLWVPIIILDSECIEISVVYLHHRVVLVILP